MKTLRRFLSGILATMLLISTARFSANSMFATLSEEELKGVNVESPWKEISKESGKVEFTGILAKNTITYDTGKYQASDEFKESIPGEEVIIKGRSLIIADWVNSQGEKALAQGEEGRYYEFKGWSTTQDVGGDVERIVYQPGDALGIIQDTTLYAVWEEKEVNKFEVKYYKNCEDASITAPVDEQLYESGGKFTVLAIEDIREGYTFEGWSTNRNATTPDGKYEVGKEVEITGDVALYAVWKEKEIVEFMVKYENCNYPNVTAPEDNKKYKKGDYAEVLQIVGERDGYIFKGYYEETNPLKLFQPDEQIEMKKSVVLVAKWEKAVYYVSLRYFNNSSSDDGQVLLKKEEYEKGGKASVLGASVLGASNSGYKFKGWNTKNDGTGKNYQPGNTIEITDNIDLFAFWEKIQEGDQDNEPEEPKDEPDDYNPDVPELPKEDIEFEDTEFTEDQNQIDDSGFVFDQSSGEGTDDAVEEEEENQGLSMDREGLSLDAELAGDEELEEESDSQINIRRRYVIKHLYYTVVNGKFEVVDTVLTPEDGVSEVENDISEAVVHTLDKDGYTYVADDSLDMVYDEENDIYTISLKYYDFAAVDYMGSLQGNNDIEAVEKNKDWVDDLVDTGLLIGSIAAVLILLSGMVVVKFGFIKKQ